MLAVENSAATLPISSFPAGTDTQWETRSRVVWNEQEHAREEHEFVYEISWIGELGLWRTFLRSHQKVNR